MSRPDLAVRAVEVLSDLGYGAAVELPSDGATDSVLLAWPTGASEEGTAIPATVRAVDRRAVQLHDPARDAFGDRRTDVDRLHDVDARSPSGDTPRHERGREHVVRPRRIWSGVTCAAIGFVVTAVGVMAQTWWVAVVGVVLVVIGAAAILAGGGMYDVHATRPLDAELREVRTGEEHEGVEPGEMVDDPRVEGSAAEIERGRQRLMSRAARRRRPH